MIKFIGLVENTTQSTECKSKHGLCIYIETKKHKILFDVGPDETFIKNASKLGVKLDEVDTVIISHGHADHGGALGMFLQINSKAKIYIRESAFEKHYTSVLGIPFSVGLNSSLKNNNQFVYTNEDLVIDDELRIFSGVTSRKLYSKANNKLLAKYNGKITFDQFEHEHYLIISDEDEDYLISGCSHNGIVNIIDKYSSISNSEHTLKMVMGGFHLFNPVTKKYESDELIDGVATSLFEYNCQFYTCHCTGVIAFNKLKDKMGDRLGYLSVGTII